MYTYNTYIRIFTDTHTCSIPSSNATHLRECFDHAGEVSGFGEGIRGLPSAVSIFFWALVE